MALDANILAGLISSNIEDIAYQYREAEKSPDAVHLAFASGIVDHINVASDAVTEEDVNDILDPIRDDIDGINTSVDDLRDDLASSIDDILATRDELDGVFKPQLNLEVLNRKETDKELFKTTTSLAELRRRSEQFEDDITNVLFEVNPDDGTFNVRAYTYTDNAFTQAGLLIDGVEGQVTIQAGRITDLGNAVEDANASIDVLAGEIELRATYTEMTEFVSGALDAIIPAYSFGFFNSAEGWTAVNGAITQGNGFIATTIGDIENRSLSYSADENPIITIVTTRTQGTGFVGDLIVYYESDIPRTYSGVLTQKEIDSQNVQNLNLSEEITYTGTVTGLQLVLGETTDDVFEIDSITIGKPSAQLEALEGITAKVNKLGIDIDAIEGQITTFVTTAYYDENTVTLNNVTQVLDGEEAIISLKATQTLLNDQGTVDKANTAAIWVDGADANIRTSVVSFNAEEGGIDDQIAGITGSLDVINQELSTIDGARIRSNLLSINRLEIASGDLEEAQFYTELKLLDQRNNDLAIGDSVAIVDTQVKTLATDQSATAQEILELKASTGTIEGQVNANSTRIQQAETNINGNASAIAGITTQVENVSNDLSQAELLLDSTIDDLGVVSSRAYLGVSTVVGGKREITGVTFDSQDNGIRFKGDIFELADNSGQTALYYNAGTNVWVFSGELQAASGTFTGTVSAGNIVSSDISASTITGSTITGGVIRGAKVEMIGTNFMKVQSATPFGPNNLIEWYGPKAGNISGSDPIYNNLTKVNAITYLGDDGSAYFGGTIIAGTLTTAKATSDIGSEIQVSSGVFGSNGGQIAIACGISSVSASDSTGTCPILANPTVQIRLYEVVGGVNQLVKLENYTGVYNCTQEGAQARQEWEVSGSFTFFDNQLSTSNREYVLQATLSDMGLDNRSQRLSIVTQEA